MSIHLLNALYLELIFLNILLTLFLFLLFARCNYLFLDLYLLIFYLLSVILLIFHSFIQILLCLIYFFINTLVQVFWQNFLLRSRQILICLERILENVSIRFIWFLVLIERNWNIFSICFFRTLWSNAVCTKTVLIDNLIWVVILSVFEDASNDN